MSLKFTTIRLSLPFRMGSVNCYLFETGAGFFLVDTGGSNRRSELVRVIEAAGCRPGLLNLVILTHGDFDHTGNAAYLRQSFGSRIVMHVDDLGMAARGDMFANRKQPNPFFKHLIPVFAGFGKAERFTPDFLLEDGDNLAPYGLDATVVSIPGHSRGSIGILTQDGDFFCGDLLENVGKPGLSTLTDDPAAASASLVKLKALQIRTVYPGHGWPFPLELIWKYIET